jgi:hypothetical protein
MAKDLFIPAFFIRRIIVHTRFYALFNAVKESIFVASDNIPVE